MKTIFRLLCGWMVIALAACTGDELQQIEPLQKPVAQKTISVKAYTPSEQAATRLAFEDKGAEGLKLSWSKGDAFTAVIDNNKVRFEYDEDSKEFTANVAQDVTLTDGLKAYYPAYDGENFEKDFSIQTDTLNSATTYMEGVYEVDAFKFTHSTAILKATFSGLPQDATISSVGIDVVAGERNFQIAISQPANDLYINLPAIAKDGKLTFDVRTSDGTLYTATKTVRAEKGIETGVYYNTTVELQEACLLPTGDEFKSAVNSFLNGKSLTKIKFVANSSNTNKDNQISNSRAYMVVGSDNTLEIHTSAAEFVFNEDCNHMFFSLSTITAIDFNNSVNTAKVTNMSYMFNNCSALESLNVSSFNTAKVTNMSYMFSHCETLTSLNVSSFNTSNVTKMDGMFSYCKTLTSLDLNNFNTPKVMDMGNMFNTCSALESLNLSSFNTEKVINMSFMFQDCSSLESLNVSSFNTANVMFMNHMFSRCSSLTSLDLSNFNTTNVTKMYNMFNNCSSLTSLDLSNFNTSKVTTMASMFDGCTKLTSLNVSSFNTANVTDMSYMFNYCQKLTSLNVSSFNTANVTDMKSMFFNCESLSSLDLSSFDFNGVKILGDPQSFSQMFTDLGEKAAKRPIPVYVTMAGYNVLSEESTSINNSYAKYMVLCELPKGNSFNSAVNYFLNGNTLTKIKFVAKSSNTNTSNPISDSGAYMVANGETLEIHTSAAQFMFNEDCNHMFSSLSTITAINFYDCINTAKVTNMSYMFNNCSSLTSLDLSSFNFDRVTDFSGMFTDLGKNAVNKPIPVYVTQAGYDILMSKSTGVDGSNAEYALACELPTGGEFKSAVETFLQSNSSLTKIKFVTNSDNTDENNQIGTSGAYMVANGETLEIHTSAAQFMFNEDCNSMFADLSNITAIDFNDCVNTAKVTIMSYMFYDCFALTSLDLSSFDFKENVVLTSMFFNLGSEVTNKPISVYVKDANDKQKLESANTGINSSFAEIKVKQP